MSTLLVVLAFFLIHSLGLLSFIEQKYLDTLTRLSYSEKPSEQIVIISADDKEWPIPEEKLFEVIKKINEAKPLAVAYNLPLSKGLIKYVEDTNTIPSIYPTQVTINETLNLEKPFSVNPMSALAITLPDVDGIFRNQPLFFNTSLGTQATFPIAILIKANLLENNITLKDSVAFFGSKAVSINQIFSLPVFFFGSTKLYSYIPINKILSKEIGAKELQGKILFVGATKINNARMLLTPVRKVTSPMPETEFFALATNTILAQKTIKPVSNVLFFIVLVLVCFISSLFFLKLTPLNSLFILLMVIVVLLTSGYIMFSSLYYQFPAIHLSLSVSCCLIAITISRITNLNQSISRILLYLRFQERSAITISDQPIEKTLGDDWWENIADVTSQYLNLPGQIFMERPYDLKHLKIVCQRGINLNEIVEKRRDITRTPYSLVINNKTPQTVEKFFSDGRLALAIPLFYSSYLMGFWVLLVNQDANYYKKHEKIIYSLATEISNSLVSKQNLQGLNSSAFLDVLGLERLSKELESLEEITEHLLYEKELLSSVLDSETDALAACNILGKVFAYNNALVNILNEAKITFNKTNCFETICLLGKFQSNLFRNDLNKITSNLTGLSTAITVFSEPNKFYNLTISPILPLVNHPNQSIKGFTFRLVNIKQYKDFDDAKSKLLTNISNLSQNLLTPILGYSELLLESNDISGDDKEMVGYVNERAQKLAKLLNQTSSMAETQIIDSKSQLAPANVILLLNEMLEELDQNISNGDIKIDFQYPQVISAIICKKLDLKQALKTLFNFLIKHTSPNHVISINLTEREDDMVIEMVSKSSGMPTNVLNQLLERNATTNLETEINLSQAKEIFQNHNGVCLFESSLEFGIRIVLTVSKNISPKIENMETASEVN